MNIIEKIDAAGDFVTGDDGFVCFWPAKVLGAFTSHNLRVIADELDKRNKAWEEDIEKYFRENPPQTRAAISLSDMDLSIEEANQIDMMLENKTARPIL